jgi:hypothetical protein
MLGEVPLDGLVHELAIAGSQVEGRAGAGAGGDRPAGPDVVAPAGPGCYGPAPRLPDDVRDETGGVATVENLGWLNLPETLTVREDAGWPSVGAVAGLMETWTDGAGAAVEPYLSGWRGRRCGRNSRADGRGSASAAERPRRLHQTGWQLPASTAPCGKGRARPVAAPSSVWPSPGCPCLPLRLRRAIPGYVRRGTDADIWLERPAIDPSDAVGPGRHRGQPGNQAGSGPDQRAAARFASVFPTVRWGPQAFRDLRPWQFRSGAATIKHRRR